MQFTRPSKVSDNQWAKRMYCSKSCSQRKVKNLTDIEIADLYRYGMSSCEIAPLAKVTARAVILALKRENVVIRTPTERLTISHSRQSYKEAASKARTGIPCPESVKRTLRARIGEKNHNWRGGVTKDAQGYLCYTASPSNGKNAGRHVHRVVAEQSLGRPLEPKEVVHHKDHDKTNNDPDNLQVMTHSEHARYHAIKSKLGRNKNA